MAQNASAPVIDRGHPETLIRSLDMRISRSAALLSLSGCRDNTNNEAEQVIRMGKLRIKVSGYMRSMHGAETFCAIRSYLATATRHGIGWLDALTRAGQGHPWVPGTT
jgi:hypothetical protein